MNIHPLRHDPSDLALAARNGDTKMVQLLLNNADNIYELISTQNVHGESALPIAAARGHIEIVKLIITKYKELEDYVGPIPLVKNNYTSLLTAIRSYAKILDGTQVKVGVYNENKVDSSYFGIIQKLLNTFPDDVDIPDNKGCTPLYYAALEFAKYKKGNKESKNGNRVEIFDKIIKILIEYGANPNYRNNASNRTPQEIMATVGVSLNLHETKIESNDKTLRQESTEKNYTIDEHNEKKTKTLKKCFPGDVDFKNKLDNNCFKLNKAKKQDESWSYLLFPQRRLKEVRKNNKKK